MIIHPEGLLEGERICRCSDDAQTHFARLLSLGNSFGRFELSVPKIWETAYGSYRKKPTAQQLTAWIKEYHENHLLFIYATPEGAIWGQWAMPKSAYPRHKKAECCRTPAPLSAEFDAYVDGYQARKRAKAAAQGNYIIISEHFGSLPKSSEDFGAFPHGEGVGIGVGKGVGVGEEQKQQQSSPEAPLTTEEQKPAVLLQGAGATTNPVPSVETRAPRASQTQPTAEQELPEWVPVEAWSDFAAMRTEIKHPLKVASRKAALRELAKLRDEGHDPTLVLQKATANVWRGLFGSPETMAPKPKPEWVEISPEEQRAMWLRDFGDHA